ncbi:epsE [Symbiodinium sp. CCMP2456]|nr:epsE [Symbiodinium sp. CCMP2456]
MEALDLFGPVELFFGGAARMQAPRCQVESVDFKLCGGEMHFEVLGVEIGNLAPCMSDWMLRVKCVNFVVNLTSFMKSGLDQLVIEELTLVGLEVTVEKRRNSMDNVEELLDKIPHNAAGGNYPNEGKLLIKKTQAHNMVVHLVLPMPDDEPCTLSLMGPSIHSTDLSESRGEADRMIQLLLKEIFGSASRVVSDPAKDSASSAGSHLGRARSTSNAGASKGSTLHGIVQYSLDSLCFFSADVYGFFQHWLPSK